MDLFLKHKRLIPDAVWHSPYKRAEETATAQIIGTDFGITPQEELALGDFFDEDELLQKLPPPNEKLCICLVGHAPQLMRLATYFAGQPCYAFSPTPSSALIMRFSETVAPGKVHLADYYTPEADLR